MEATLLTALSAATVVLTMAYYWVSSAGRGMGLAYAVAIINGILCTAVNTLLGMKPGQEAMYLYNVSSAWIVLMGAKGLIRMRQDRQMLRVSVNPLPYDAELRGYIDEEGYVDNSTRKIIEELEERDQAPPLEAM